MAYENPGWTAQLVVGQVRAAGGFDTSESSAFGVAPGYQAHDLEFAFGQRPGGLRLGGGCVP